MFDLSTVHTTLNPLVLYIIEPIVPKAIDAKIDNYQEKNDIETFDVQTHHGKHLQEKRG